MFEKSKKCPQCGSLPHASSVVGNHVAMCEKAILEAIEKGSTSCTVRMSHSRSVAATLLKKGYRSMDSLGDTYIFW
jgi:hypothetical protein